MDIIITKLTKNSTGTIDREEVQYLSVTKEDIETKIVPMLNKVNKVELKRAQLYGSNHYIKYDYEEIAVIGVEELAIVVNQKIKANVKLINESIDIHNKACKRSNKLNNRDLDENMLEQVKEIDYLYIG